MTRQIDLRKKPSVAFWATVVVVVVLLAYPLSFGPACWVVTGGGLRTEWTLRLYRPLIRNAHRSPIRQYAWLWGIDSEDVRILNVALDLLDQEDAIVIPVNPPVDLPADS
jgi:hypothetical protein